MTINNWLTEATKTLTDADIATARLDCLVLLEDCLHTDRAHLLAHPETTLTVEQEKLLDNQVARRATHEPLAYIRGKTEFYGREFIVNQAVLEPRPETENMIDLLKELDDVNTVLDVGTGSGAIGITAALELTVVQVIATDIDPKCLAVARHNCEKHKATVDLRQTNLIEGIELPKNSVVMANLPYVPDSHVLNKAAMNEPKLAIFGGEDGLDLYRQLFEQINQQKHKPTHVLTEALPFQHESLHTIAAENGYKLVRDSDFIQLFVKN